jgi:hypothetical protein
MAAEVPMRCALLLVLVALIAGACSSTPPAPAPEPEAGTTDPAPPPRRAYIGDVSTHVFHREGCPELEQVDLSNQRLLESPGEALDRGFAPCKTCDPLHGW